MFSQFISILAPTIQQQQQLRCIQLDNSVAGILKNLCHMPLLAYCCWIKCWKVILHTAWLKPPPACTNVHTQWHDYYVLGFIKRF